MTATRPFKGDNRLLLGIILGVITFWLFAQSVLNVVPTLQESFSSNAGTINIAVSLTALFSGLFVVGAGSIADKIGRVKMTYIGLILSVVGSLLIIVSNLSALLIIGRIIQGFSAACIMPATLAIVNEYYQGKDRQRALSYWSIGSWGGSGITSYFGGLMATFVGWRWIFIVSIIVAILAMILIRHTPETKASRDSDVRSHKFDVVGLVVLAIMMLSLNVIITQTSHFGFLSPLILSLTVVFIVSVIFFLIYEKKLQNPLIDFDLFKHKGYSGAVISNFALNAVAGTLIVANTYFQQGLGFTSNQSGMMSITYLITVLVMIRVGEKIMQKLGAKRPMLYGSLLNAAGMLLIALTFLPTGIYVVSSVIGYLLFGLGLGMYATPSTDTAVTSAPDNKVGTASGIYKMASSLGNAFGIAISGTIYAVVSESVNLQVGAMAGIGFNILLGLIAFVTVLFLVPKSQGETY
ncbi:MFS transporter [Staphylococcus simulans]|uniref:Quinolone resistance protein NorB n=2 Tax=Staphylococcus TaxID=1279 RepID=A0A6N3CPE9_STASI|nr:MULTISPECIES: MFS transporter [Staphylococcus]MBO0386678.1 MFS transporter [Staphylococcus simulans]MBU6942767.1 MFS transporter [Staphylococcus sp. CWZ226]MDN6062806.1 MFS transporter [Staphylococcus simulans]MDN6232787.1 MFS transporter [Staphylococcus simulans]MDN6261592.1 MFS transporter [Staphylococcus simulans]